MLPSSWKTPLITLPATLLRTPPSNRASITQKLWTAGLFPAVSFLRLCHEIFRDVVMMNCCFREAFRNTFPDRFGGCLFITPLARACHLYHCRTTFHLMAS